MIEDLVPAADQSGIAKAKELHAEAVKSMTDGIGTAGLGEAYRQVTGSSGPAS